MLIELKENTSRPGVFVTPDGRVFVECLPGTVDEAGYTQITIPGGADRGNKSVNVRRYVVVAEAYHGPRPFKGAHVRHLNGMPSEDNKDNLCWGTAEQNGQDTVAHGRTTRGEKNRHSRLTETHVLDIKRRITAGESVCELAAEFNVSQPTVSDIKRGSSWGWLKAY